MCFVTDKPFLEYIKEDCKDWPSFKLEEFIENVEIQVESAVDYLHSKNHAHNDLSKYYHTRKEQFCSVTKYG